MTTHVLDEDVLDTWFSSGLLPFSIFGWPDTVSEYVYIGWSFKEVRILFENITTLY